MFKTRAVGIYDRGCGLTSKPVVCRIVGTGSGRESTATIAAVEHFPSIPRNRGVTRPPPPRHRRPGTSP